MFVESITSSREEWQRFSQGVRLASDPPEALVLSVSWDAGEDRVTVLNVWDTAEAVADFYVDRVHTLIQQHGEPIPPVVRFQTAGCRRRAFGFRSRVAEGRLLLCNHRFPHLLLDVFKPFMLLILLLFAAAFALDIAQLITRDHAFTLRMPPALRTIGR